MKKSVKKKAKAKLVKGSNASEEEINSCGPTVEDQW